jgi:hypothetical protein
MWNRFGHPDPVESFLWNLNVWDISGSIPAEYRSKSCGTARWTKADSGSGYLQLYIFRDFFGSSWQHRRVREFKGAITKTLSIPNYGVSKPKFRSFKVMLD